MRSVLSSLAILAVPAVLAGQSLPATSTWSAEWRDPEGHRYTAEVTLQHLGGKVEGVFVWTLRVTPRADLREKVGLTGRELVRGSYDPSCGLLQIGGYQLDDPNGILGTDQYRLVLSPEGTHLAGVTASGGAWNGVLTGSRR